MGEGAETQLPRMHAYKMVANMLACVSVCLSVCLSAWMDVKCMDGCMNACMRACMQNAFRHCLHEAFVRAWWIVFRSVSKPAERRWRSTSGVFLTCFKDFDEAQSTDGGPRQDVVDWPTIRSLARNPLRRRAPTRPFTERQDLLPCISWVSFSCEG